MFTGFLFYMFITSMFRKLKWFLSLAFNRVDGQGFLGNSAPANMIIVNFVVDPGSSNINVIVFIFMYANVFVFVKRR